MRGHDYLWGYPWDYIRRGLRKLNNTITIESPDCLRLGRDIYLGDHVWISNPKWTCEKGKPPKRLNPLVTIGDGTYIGRFTTISCINRITIGKNVMISERCFIGDCYHGYQDRDVAIIDQYLFSPGPVRIGDGSWIGPGVAILPDVNIGKHCMIRANSVVNIDIPDYSVAAGNPIRVICNV